MFLSFSLSLPFPLSTNQYARPRVRIKKNNGENIQCHRRGMRRGQHCYSFSELVPTGHPLSRQGLFLTSWDPEEEGWWKTKAILPFPAQPCLDTAVFQKPPIPRAKAHCVGSPSPWQFHCLGSVTRTGSCFLQSLEESQIFTVTTHRQNLRSGKESASTSWICQDPQPSSLSAY